MHRVLHRSRINMAKHSLRAEPNNVKELQFRAVPSRFLFSSQRTPILPVRGSDRTSHQGPDHPARHILRIQFSVTSGTGCLFGALPGRGPFEGGKGDRGLCYYSFCPISTPCSNGSTSLKRASELLNCPPSPKLTSQIPPFLHSS